MLTFDHFDDERWQKARAMAAAHRDMLDVPTSAALYASGDRIDYVVRKGDEARLQLHLLASGGEWAEA